jgi:acyl-coenzyme A synthetase/AMP-(fatty) acid ligase
MLGNGPEAFAAWYGAARLGALVVPVSTRLTAPEAAYIVADSGAIVLVHDGHRRRWPPLDHHRRHRPHGGRPSSLVLGVGRGPLTTSTWGRRSPP